MHTIDGQVERKQSCTATLLRPGDYGNAHARATDVLALTAAQCVARDPSVVTTFVNTTFNIGWNPLDPQRSTLHFYKTGRVWVHRSYRPYLFRTTTPDSQLGFAARFKAFADLALVEVFVDDASLVAKLSKLDLLIEPSSSTVSGGGRLVAPEDS